MGSTSLSRPQQALIERLERDGELVISAITLWEIAKLVEAKRLSIPRPLDLWLAEIEQHPLIEVAPLTPKIITTGVALGNFHRDPVSSRSGGSTDRGDGPLSGTSFSDQR